MVYEQFKKIIYKNDFNRSKSYFNRDNSWITSRCRIDVSLYIDVIFDYIVSKESIDVLTEKYLYLTRKMSKKNKKYKKSNSMDVNALLNWYNINRNIKKSELIINNLNEIELKEYIKKYIKWIHSITPLNKIIEEYNERIDDFTKPFDFNHIKSIVDDYCKHSNILNINDISKISFFKNANRIYDTNFEYNEDNDETKKMVGYIGEKLVYNFLLNEYGKENVRWKSEIEKHCPYDFEIDFNGFCYYIEVKASQKNRITFYLSRNEYEFYKKNKENYSIFFVSNITPDYKNINPILYKIDSPNIEINDKKYGVDENILFLTPSKYKGII